MLKILIFGFELNFEYSVSRELATFAQSWSDLESDPNPSAVVQR